MRLKLSSFSLYGQWFLIYMPIFKIAILWYEIWQLAKVPEVAHTGILSFYSGGRNQAYFHSTGSGYRHTGRFSKLPYLGIKLGLWPYTLFLPQWFEIELFSLYGHQFPRHGPIFKIAIFEHETWPLPKVPEVAHILSFYPRGSNLSSFLLYGQRFSRYCLIFKIGHETWPLSKVPKVAHILSFYPRGLKLSLCSLYGQRFPRFPKLPYLA